MRYTGLNARRGAAVITVAAVSLGLAACGGSDKPQYCEDRSTLQQSVTDLGKVDVLSSGGLKALQAQFQKVRDNAEQLVASAKSDFPDQTKAIQSSLNSLVAAVEGLPDNPDPAQLGPLATDAAAVVSSFDAFLSATDDKCK